MSNSFEYRALVSAQAGLYSAHFELKKLRNNQRVALSILTTMHTIQPSTIFIIFIWIISLNFQEAYSQREFIYVSTGSDKISYTAAQAYCQQNYGTSLYSIHSMADNIAMRNRCIEKAGWNQGTSSMSIIILISLSHYDDRLTLHTIKSTLHTMT